MISRSSSARLAKHRVGLKHARALTIILAVGVSLIPPSFGRVLAASCGNFYPPEVTVKITKTALVERFDVTAGDLQSAAAASGIQPHWPALGAYTSAIAYAANIAENAAEEGKGLYCAVVGSVQMELSLKNRVIHLARELHEDRCLEEGQRQHLREHARAEEAAVEEFPVLELRAGIEKIHVSQAPSPSIAKSQVTTAVHQEIKRLLVSVTARRAELYEKIDAPEAIESLRGQIQRCSAERPQ